MKNTHKLFLGSVALLGFSIFGASHASAAIINVNSISPGTQNGQCTFEDAVKAHETLSAIQGCTAGDGNDTINLPSNIQPMITSGVVNITKGNLTIKGVNVRESIISGTENHPILNITADGPVTLNDITLTKSSGNSAIFSSSNLELKNILFEYNYGKTDGTTKGGGLTMKGQISNRIALNATNVTFKVNGNAKGSSIEFEYTDAAIKNGTFAYNFYLASNSSAIYSNASNINIINSTFTAHPNPVFKNDNGSHTTFKNSIVNANWNYFQPGSDKACENVDTNSTFTSQGNNLLYDTTCGQIETDVVSKKDFFLGELSNRTSAIPTIALLKNNPAIGLGDKASCPLTDARGVNRSKSDRCDAGSYELDRPAALGVYRFSSRTNGEHIYVSEPSEFNFLKTSDYGKNNWNFENYDETVFTVESESNNSNIPVSRLRNTKTGLHLYTSDQNEINTITKIGWENEGVKFYAGQVQSGDGLKNKSNIYRFFNKYTGEHLLTKNDIEINNLINSTYGKANWNNEGDVYSSGLIN